VTASLFAASIAHASANTARSSPTATISWIGSPTPIIRPGIDNSNRIFAFDDLALPRFPRAADHRAPGAGMRSGTVVGARTPKQWTSNRSITKGAEMAEITIDGPIPPTSVKPKLESNFNPLTLIIFFGVLAAGLLFTAYNLYDDVESSGTRVTTWVPFLLLGVALFVALGFEFVNGFPPARARGEMNSSNSRRRRPAGVEWPLPSCRRDASSRCSTAADRCRVRRRASR
jgi:hypothetical protein